MIEPGQSTPETETLKKGLVFSNYDIARMLGLNFVVSPFNISFF